MMALHLTQAQNRFVLKTLRITRNQQPLSLHPCHHPAPLLQIAKNKIKYKISALCKKEIIPCQGFNKTIAGLRVSLAWQPIE